MKSTVEKVLNQAVTKLKDAGTIPVEAEVVIKVDRTKNKAHGDFASNIALILADKCNMPPRNLAALLIESIPAHENISRVEIAGPGFINFHLKANSLNEVIATILALKNNYGRTNDGKGQKVLLEYVSANPTGPLHVGHGRSAAFGASLANVLLAAGYSLVREYYVNDAGRQMNILAASVWLRYLALSGEPVVFPANGYRGDYVSEISATIELKYGKNFVHDWMSIVQKLPKDEPEGGDKERYIDAVIDLMKELLGEASFAIFHKSALNFVLDDIKQDLSEFGVLFDDWFSEQSLFDSGSIEQGILALKNAGHTYESGGALWFRATAFGDEKDRVLVRANGQTTYFASDVAYHWNKYHRGFSRVINIFGADHHGYITRLKSAVNALGHDDKALTVLLVQFAILYRHGERVQMSTRSGSFVTLRELREEVGNDAARFFYVMRKPEQHMDFDLDLAKSESNDNPVYYIQYAHARICSVERQLKTRGLSWDEGLGLSAIDRLDLEQESALILALSRYPETVSLAAKTCEPHLIAYYLRELAALLHSYYNAAPILAEDDALRSARLCLLKAVRYVLCNGMQLLGVSAPESM